MSLLLFASCVVCILRCLHPALFASLILASCFKSLLPHDHAQRPLVKVHSFPFIVKIATYRECNRLHCFSLMYPAASSAHDTNTPNPVLFFVNFISFLGSSKKIIVFALRPCFSLLYWPIVGVVYIETSCSFWGVSLLSGI